jgi:hypothetical protein
MATHRRPLRRGHPHPLGATDLLCRCQRHDSPTRLCSRAGRTLGASHPLLRRPPTLRWTRVSNSAASAATRAQGPIPSTPGPRRTRHRRNRDRDVHHAAPRPAVTRRPSCGPARDRGIRRLISVPRRTSQALKSRRLPKPLSVACGQDRRMRIRLRVSERPRTGVPEHLARRGGDCPRGAVWGRQEDIGSYETPVRIARKHGQTQLQRSPWSQAQEVVGS